MACVQNAAFTALRCVSEYIFPPVASQPLLLYGLLWRLSDSCCVCCRTSNHCHHTHTYIATIFGRFSATGTRNCPPAISNSKKGGNHPQFTPKVAELFGKIQAQHLTKNNIVWALNSVCKVLFPA